MVTRPRSPVNTNDPNKEMVNHLLYADSEGKEMIQAKIHSVFICPNDDDPREQVDLVIEGDKNHWTDGLAMRIPFLFYGKDLRIQFLQVGIIHDLADRSVTDTCSRGYLNINWSDDRPVWEGSEVKFEVFLARPEDLHAMNRLQVAFKDLMFALPDDSPAFKNRR
jgi:hypothetical protein